MKKVGRNDPCPCGSGKKFKKCCEKKMIGKRFMAKKIEDTNISSKINMPSANISSLFNRVTPLQSSPQKEDAEEKKDSLKDRINKDQNKEEK